MRELVIGADALFFLRHADMRLIDDGGHVALRRKALVGPLKFPLRRPDLAVEAAGIRVLHDAVDIKRDMILHAAGMGDLHFDVGEVLEGVLSPQGDLPVSVIQARHGMGLSIPLIKIADEMHRGRVRGPFAVDPAALRTVKAVKQVAVREFIEADPGG